MRSLQRITDSILAADVGTVWTRVLLMDRVGEVYRFVARGDVPTTHGDVAEGVRAAAREIERHTGRTLLDREGDLITPETSEGGVDLFLVSASAAAPLRVAVGGLSQRVSVASAQRAARGTYSDVVASFALDDPLGPWGIAAAAPDLVERLAELWPDVLLLSGGLDGSSDRSLLELADAIALVLMAAPDRQPPVLLYAGNSEMADAVQARLGDNSPLMISDNLRPTLTEERLRQTARLLDQQYRVRALNQIPGLGQLRLWSGQEPLPTAEALARVVQFLALRHEQRVLGVDVGGGAVTLSATFPDLLTQSTVRPDLGLALGAESLLAQAGGATLAAWVPGLATPEALANQFANVALYPAQQPLTRDTLLLLQGAAREAIARTLAEASAMWPRPVPGLATPFDVILGTGSVIAAAPRPAQALLLLLDALQPIGVSRLLRDRFSLSAAIGSIADSAPQAAADLMEAQGFESLGVAICPIGRFRPGSEVLRFRLTQGGGITEGVVEAGELFVFPTPEQTTLELTPSRDVDLGQGSGVPVRLSSAGDRVGFVIDARGRPLPMPTDPVERRQRVEEWLTYVGA